MTYTVWATNDSLEETFFRPIERKLSAEQNIKDDSHRPDVYRLATWLEFDDLWSHEIRSADTVWNYHSLGLWWLNGCKTKFSNQFKLTGPKNATK